jgi:hypothetical protein
MKELLADPTTKDCGKPMKKHQIAIAPFFLSRDLYEFAHFSEPIKPGARGEHSKKVHGRTPNQQALDSE